MKVSISTGLLCASALFTVTSAHCADDQALLKRMVDGAKVMRMISSSPKTFELVNVQYDAPKDVICMASSDTAKKGAGLKLASNSAGKSIPWTDTCEKNAGVDWTARVKAQL
ncbi:hypothetical protein [Comamonas thiooxydans]|uniref:hypothetical protein n=1 Tax=Comamonas thiooxydans TaxID=363952 RepID=UPI0013DC1053|nr:hypothetical protein [Comamonas thiooxydans]